MKTIVSPVKKFKGSVTLPDYLTMPQVMAWDNASRVQRKLLGVEGQSFDTVEEWREFALKKMAEIPPSELDNALVVAICDIVEKWELAGLPEKLTSDKFPGSPRAASGALIRWLSDEINKIYEEEIEVPNE